MAFDIDDMLVPSWARWIAQDADGIWWVYEVEPLQFLKGWYENEVGKYQHLGKDKKPIDWKITLERVNNTQ